VDQLARPRSGSVQSVIDTTCEVNAINPFEYLADVLPRLASHPASRIDELLPHRWKPPGPAPPSYTDSEVSGRRKRVQCTHVGTVLS
jgi:hypothetical protein